MACKTDNHVPTLAPPSGKVTMEREPLTSDTSNPATSQALPFHFPPQASRSLGKPEIFNIVTWRIYFVLFEPMNLY